MRLPVLRSHATLQPQELSQAAQDAVGQLLREGESQNTLASYRSALRYWAAWFVLRYGVALAMPMPAAAVMQFVVDHAERSTEHGLRHELPKDIDQTLVANGFKGKLGPLALNTIVHRLAVLSKAHQMREVKNPCDEPKVRELLSKTRRAFAKRGERPAKKDALTSDPLQALLATCDESLRGKRDRALLLFAWSSGGRRRSEVANADIGMLSLLPGGDFVYNLAHSKTNQAGTDRPDNYKPVVGAAAQAMAQWLEAASIREGRIFRRILRGGHVGSPLSAAAVRDIVISRCKLAGVEGAFSAHSLRSGFVTEADRQGLRLADTMALTGHTSISTVMGYTRASESNRAAALKALSALRGTSL
ncbi:site-specific integrase [Ramlibacter sp. WS9]|uniref:site-specific integrase n=1 Tax=Ramlibacter sp. WS9 TaxID=1882741 RepID=UPI001144D1C5|nr:site-specific integrase [Ramlibacter sp. WS9]ROZ77999.1 integrase [Ramlibacter sp. WS9]